MLNLWLNLLNIFHKESVILYIGLWIFVAVFNPTCVELQQTDGWIQQVFEQITFIDTMAFLTGLPFINLRNTKW